MERVGLFALLSFALASAISSTKSVASVSTSSHKDRGVVTFTQPVRLLNVTLKGEYLFVHDNAAVLRGEQCTFVYKGTIESPRNLVISFHCKPEARKKATHFTVRTKQSSPGVNEIKEIQFAGSTEAHLVSTHHSHTVTLTNV